jgi:diguanylate cyclase (GGDEF)-like protein
MSSLAAPVPAAAASDLVRQVYAIEARHGNEPKVVIEQLRPLEGAARASGGEDLRAFLAAWGYAHAATNKPAIADAAIEELTEIGERSHDDAALASAYTLKASLLGFDGQMRAAFGWIESALPLAAKIASADTRYWIDMTGADLAVTVGHLDEGVRLYEASTAAARESRNPRREAQSILSLLPLRIARGDYDAAFRAAARARAIAAHSTDRSQLASSWIMEAFAAEAAGQPERAADARRHALQAQRDIPASAANTSIAASATGDSGINVQSNTWLANEVDALVEFANLHGCLHDYPQAHAFAQRALHEAAEQHDDYNVAQATIELGLADIGAGHVALGRAEADRGIAALHRDDRRADLLVQLNRYTEMLERAGESGPALARLRESLLLENELARKDRQNMVLALQKQSTLEQRQRHTEQLVHENALQAVEIERRDGQRTLTLLLAAVMGLGVVVAGRLAVNNAELAFASLHDKVTGLSNRRAMEADTAAMALAVDAAYCIVTISVKQFGLIVGSVGHQLGDTLVCQIATRLADVVTRFDGRLYRVDGVTFGALFTFGRDDGHLRAILEALAGAMEAPFEIGNQDLIVSIGVGASEYPKDAHTAQEVARLAELAKLQAHADPGNSFLVYDARIGESQRDKLRMESRMLKALEHGDFELFYQGQRGLPHGRICGFEALLRWRDGDKMISPAEFIPLAEETGLIVRIGAWVLQQACRQARDWADSGAGKPLVAVNISPRQFNHPDFLETVRETLRTTGVDPRQIELEITEGSVMNDAEASIAQLHALRALGLHLAIDDFGTGYASLSYLRRFPLDRLKIDRSFIMQLNESEQDDTIVRTVIELAHTLGLSVTAEGVETIEQETVLQRWGCDVIQGFLRFRPAPAGAATGFLEKDKLDAVAEATA